jgi:DNA-binding beta-propeller fold protein YncE
MVINKLIFNLMMTACVLLSASVYASAQNVSVFASDLKAPTRLLVTEGGNLLVAEAGEGINTGRVSIIDRAGQRRTLIDGLPAAPRCGELFEKNSGPAGLALRGTTLFIPIGAGDNCGEPDAGGGDDEGYLSFHGNSKTAFNGTAFVENPNPASPLLRSILTFKFTEPIDALAGGFSLPAILHAVVASGAEITLTGTGGAQAQLRQLVQFPFQPAECLYPGLFGDCPNYASDPSALALFGQSLFVVDGRLRVVYQTSLETGAFVTHPLCLNDSECESFGFRSNAPFPANTGLSVAGDKLLVTLDSGDIRSLDPTTGAVTAFKDLSTDEGTYSTFGDAAEALTIQSRCSGELLYVLQPDSFFCFQGHFDVFGDVIECSPSIEQLVRFDSRTGKFILVAILRQPGDDPQDSRPVSLAHDARTGQIFVALFGTNQIVRVTDPDVDLMTQPEYDVSIQNERSGHLLRFNSRTGEYVFTRCGADGFTFSGKGSVRGQGCRIELRDARVTAEIDRCPIAPRNTGRAIISVTPVGPFFALFDRDITSHACGCPG